jgi:hypothetical protein
MQTGDAFLWYVVVCQVAPLGWALLPLGTDSYGDSDLSWCWITQDNVTSRVWRSLSLSTTWLAVAYCVWVHASASNKFAWIRQAAGNTTREAFLQEHPSAREADRGETSTMSPDERLECIHRLKYYPLALVVAQSVGTINRLSQFFGPTYTWLCVAQVATQCLQGLFHSGLFFQTPIVRNAIARRCRSGARDNGDGIPGSFLESDNRLDNDVTVWGSLMTRMSNETSFIAAEDDAESKRISNAVQCNTSMNIARKKKSFRFDLENNLHPSLA